MTRMRNETPPLQNITRGRRVLCACSLLLALSTLAACRGKGDLTSGSPAPAATTVPKPAPPPVRDPAAEAARVAHDVGVVKNAQDLANEFLQKSGDCTALRAGLVDVQLALDAANEKARTDAAHDTIRNLKKQAEDASSACP